MKKVKLNVGSMVNQCPSCGEIFNSLGAFDKHRAGEYGKPVKDGYSPSSRHCLTHDQMISIGMLRNSKNNWISSPMPEREYV